MAPNKHPPQPASAAAPESTESLLRLIADSVPALLAYYELPSMRCRFANQSYAAFHGHSTESILGLTVREAIGEHAWAIIHPYVERSIRGEHARYVREQTLHNQETRVIEVHLIPHVDGQGPQRGTFVLINDITERYRAENAVRQSEERMRKFAAATEEAIVFHRDGVIIDGNEALQRLTGYAVPEVLGLSIFSFISPEWRATALEYTRHGREDPYEVCIRHKDGHDIPVEVVGKTMPSQHADYRVVVVHDITARKQAQEREAFMARHDPLTQLPNRVYLHELMPALLAHTTGKAAVFSIDLDHFKTVNDSLGHQVGDQLLQEVAQRLRTRLGPGSIVARLGGDEFAVVLGQVPHQESAMQQANELLETVRAGVTLEGMPLSVTVSIGISLYPDHGTTPDTLLRCADAAMHHAKDSGRSHCQFYSPGMEGQALEDLQKERLLRQAIADGAFELHYQPQVDLAEGRLCGMEALVRWRHPNGTLVNPAAFIAFAEARGLITPIGQWVLQEACRQVRAWQGLGLSTVPVAVNLSALEFRQRDIAREVAGVLQSTGLAPEYLEIELTESVLMHHSDAMQATLQGLRQLGVRISVDDFGTGYSSLAYLKRYPIDKLKIDRSFVMDTPGDADDVAIMTAIIQMARGLQLRTVAEGVETPEQLALLQSLGCDLVQGFLISRPLPAEAMQAWLQNRHTAGGQYRHAAPHA